MSIASRIEAIETHLTSAYTSLTNKNATIPTDKNINNLSASIDSIFVEPLPSLPEGYEALHYIQATGTQYIDTGVALTRDHSVEIDIKIDVTGSQGIMGARVAPNVYYILQQASGNLLGYEYMGNARLVSNIVGIGYRRKIHTNQNYLYVDDVNCGSTTKISRTTLTAYIFWCHESGGSAVKTSGKLYSCKIWNGLILERNFRPAKRVSDNVLGLYDLVNGVFYTNAGTGDFIQ